MEVPPSAKRSSLKLLLLLSAILGLGFAFRETWLPSPPVTVSGAGTTSHPPAPLRASGIGTRPELILNEAGPAIFPESWLTREINAWAKPLTDRETARSRNLLQRAMDKYPEFFLSHNLRRIYVLGDLGFSQVSASGTNSLEDVYVVNQGTANRFPDDWIEKTFHAEFSSIILRNYGTKFDHAAWHQANPAGFQYEGNGVDAIRKNRFSKHFDASLHPDGFLCEYALSDLENDFNGIAEQLFLGDPAFWRLVEQHSRLSAKTGLAISFYGRLDPAFTREFFEGLCRTTAPNPD